MTVALQQDVPLMPRIYNPRLIITETHISIQPKEIWGSYSSENVDIGLMDMTSVDYESCLPVDANLACSNPAEGDKNPQHAFLRMESKTIGPNKS
jgi:hypothetical protein